MKLPDHLDKAFRRLFDFYQRREYEEGREKPSGFSNFVAAEEAREKMKRHPPLLVRSVLADGSLSGVLWADNGIRCGLVHVGPGEHYGSGDRSPDVRMAERPDQMALALAGLSPGDRMVLSWLVVGLPKHMRCFGMPFKGEDDHRALKMAPLLGVQQELDHGPAAVAALTPTARAMFGHPHDAGLGVQKMALRLRDRKPRPDDRQIARAIRAEAEVIVGDEHRPGVLPRLAAALRLAPRLPAPVRRAGIAA